jgi:hypothetical protein
MLDTLCTILYTWQAAGSDARRPASDVSAEIASLFAARERELRDRILELEAKLAAVRELTVSK